MKLIKAQSQSNISGVQLCFAKQVLFIFYLRKFLVEIIKLINFLLTAVF